MLAEEQFLCILRETTTTSPLLGTIRFSVYKQTDVIQTEQQECDLSLNKRSQKFLTYLHPKTLKTTLVRSIHMFEGGGGLQGWLSFIPSFPFSLVLQKVCYLDKMVLFHRGTELRQAIPRMVTLRFTSGQVVRNNSTSHIFRKNTKLLAFQQAIKQCMA